MIPRLAFLLAVLLPGLDAARGAESVRRPNVLLVSFDNLGVLWEKANRVPLIVVAPGVAHRRWLPEREAANAPSLVPASPPATR